MSIVASVRHFSAASAALLLVGVAVTPVDAKGPMSICKADLDKLCSTMSKAAQRRACLKENEDKLSDECKVSLEEWQATRGALRAACREDRKSLCSDVKGSARKCLLENQSKLSKPCADALAALPATKG